MGRFLSPMSYEMGKTVMYQYLPKEMKVPMPVQKFCYKIQENWSHLLQKLYM